MTSSSTSFHIFQYWKALTGAILGTAAVVAVLFQFVASASELEATQKRISQLEQSYVAIDRQLQVQKKDKIAELEGRKAVLEYIASNGGLSPGQRLEYGNIVRRLEALK